MPYLKCVDESEAKYILKEIHEGICRDHTSPRSLVSKIIRTCYFCPTMQRDTKEFERCNKCQRFGNVPSGEVDANNLPMAICLVGNRHHGPTTPR